MQSVNGVARVDGELAVSRAFGDAGYKEAGGPSQEDHPVIAAPEFATAECTPADFIMLVCDGISESSFPNRDVVQLAAKELRKAGAFPAANEVASPVDLGPACAAVCRKALEQGSQDNLSCMIVLVGEGEVKGPAQELLPGTISNLSHSGFCRAYASMAMHAGLTLVEAVELRYAVIRQELATATVGSELYDDLRQELLIYGGGPPQNLAAGSAERQQWFARWLEGMTQNSM